MLANFLRSVFRYTLRATASETAQRTWKIPARASVPLVFSRSAGRSRRCSTRACTASRASEQGCARLPESIKLRTPSSAKVAALSMLVIMPYLVSSPALARRPSAHLLIMRHPALAVLLRTAVARRIDALSSQAAWSSCSFTRTSDCRVGGTVARRGAPRQAEPRRASLARRQRGMDQLFLLLSWSAPCMPSMQPKHTAPLHPLLGRAGHRFRASDACMHGR